MDLGQTVGFDAVLPNVHKMAALPHKTQLLTAHEDVLPKVT